MNNRLLLCYRPTGHAVLLGRSLAHGWQTDASLADKLQRLFDYLDVNAPSGASQDGLIPDGQGAPFCEIHWDYGPPHQGMRQLILETDR